jgi:integrase
VLFLGKMTEERTAWINAFASGRTWLNKLPSPHTKKKFTAYFKTYCDAISKTPDELISLKMEGLKSVGTDKEWQAENLLENYFAICDKRPTAKLMIKNAVFSFYKHNRRALEGQTASNVKDETPESKKRKPTLEDLTALETVAHSARDKALIWFIASTSCRVGTVVLLKWKDLKPTENKNVPYVLEVESARLKGSGVGKYKGLKQITFLHKFAYEKLLVYKQEALKKYALNEDSPVFIKYWNKGEVEPITFKGINGIFDDLSLRAWGDLETKRFSPHDLREFFQSALESANIQANMISPIMAHKVKGVDQHYSSHDFKELLVKYEIALPYLIPQTVEQVKAELGETKTEYQKQRDTIETQSHRIEHMEEQIERLATMLEQGKPKAYKVRFVKKKEDQ